MFNFNIYTINILIKKCKSEELRGGAISIRLLLFLKIRIMVLNKLGPSLNVQCNFYKWIWAARSDYLNYISKTWLGKIKKQKNASKWTKQNKFHFYPPANKVSREVANLTERKNPNTPVFGVKEFVCLSFTNFDPNYPAVVAWNVMVLFFIQ